MPLPSSFRWPSLGWRSLGWLSYQVGLAASLALTAPWLGLRRGGSGFAHYLPTLRGRLTLDLPDSPRTEPDQAGPRRDESAAGAVRTGVGRTGAVRTGGGRLWIHAVSVGEVNVAATLVRHLPDTLPLVVSTVTPTGQALARRLFARRAEVAYLPFDFTVAIERFVRAYDPRALVLVEGDYWPLVLARMARRGAPVAVVNGRISDRAFGRQKRLGSINRLFYGSIARFGLQTEADRRRLVELGADPNAIEVTGNLKFDAAVPAAKPELAALLERLADGRPILVAGSTMEGEDEQVLRAFRHLGGGERALLVLAPRHPERFDRVAELLADSETGVGPRCSRRSQLGEDTETSAAPGAADAVLLDSLGELAAVYGLATAAFIGGTLVPTGGHNPLEPAVFGVPTAVGPSMFNFEKIARAFDEAGAWERAENGEHLGRIWRAWLDQPAAGRAVGRAAAELLAANRGAAERTGRMLEPLLAQAGLPRAAGSVEGIS